MMTQPVSEDAATEPRMEIRGQEQEAAATAGVDATCRAAGKEGLLRDIPRQLDRGFPSAARLRA